MVAKTSLCTIAASALLAIGSAAHADGAGTSAGPVTEAGETIGLALGAALPQGVYFVDTASVVHNPGDSRLGTRGMTLDVLVNIPVVAWSTPWTVFGGRVEAYGALPEAVVDSKGLGSNKPFGGSAGLYNPALLIGAAWDLGGNLHFSNFVGGYAPVDQPGFSYANGTNGVWTFNERAALSYIADGWNVTVHAIWGSSTRATDATQTNGAGLSCATVTCQRADYLNVDLAALKTFGKWEVGPAAYLTTDTSRTSDNLRGNREIALGAFAGYALGGATVQTYFTHDVANSQGHLLGGADNRLFFRLVVPLWNPAS